MSLMFGNFYPNFLVNFEKNFRDFSNAYDQDKNILDSQISWNFATKIVEFFRKSFAKLEKNRKTD